MQPNTICWLRLCHSCYSYNLLLTYILTWFKNSQAVNQEFFWYQKLRCNPSNPNRPDHVRWKASNSCWLICLSPSGSFFLIKKIVWKITMWNDSKPWWIKHPLWHPWFWLPLFTVFLQEFMAGGSLHDHLFGRTSRTTLAPRQRWLIACHTAEVGGNKYSIVAWR